jgi:hypothetical protein
VYFIFIIFCVAQFDNRGIETASPHTLYHPHASFPTSIQLLSSTTSWLLGILIDWQPPKAKATPIAQFFDGVCVSAPNKGTSSHEHKPTNDRWRMLPWQKMAKLL